MPSCSLQRQRRQSQQAAGAQLQDRHGGLRCSGGAAGSGAPRPQAGRCACMCMPAAPHSLLAPLPEAARPCRHSLRTCTRHSLLRSRPHNIRHSRARQCNLTVLYHGMSGSHTWSRHRCCANIISWQLPHGDAAHGGAVAAPQPDRQAVQLVDARAALPQLESLHCDDTLQAHRRTHTSITGASDKFSTRLQRACACTQDLAAGTRVQAPGPAGSRAAPPEPRVLQPSGGRC